MQAGLRRNDDPKSFVEHAASVKHGAVGMATDSFPPASFMDTPTGMYACMDAGESAQDENAIFILLQNQ